LFTYFKQVLYTHQKTKKSKTWQDGILRIRTGRNQATLLDDKGQCLESIFIKSQVTAGDDLESERYLITVEAAKVSEKPSEEQPRKVETPAVDRNGVKPGLLPPRHLPVGLKRKFTGFQGPRQVEKKIPAVEDEEKTTLLPLSKQCQGSFPSKFYISSPLFSTILKKEGETNPSAGFQEEGCRDNDREHLSVSSLLSAPFLDTCEETEKQNSDQSVVKPGSPLVTGQAGPGAGSHHIRSTAQIIALLKSKPAQGHREQTSGVTGCLSRFQATENADLYDKKSPVLPTFSGNQAKGLVPDIQHLPFMKRTVNDKKDWNAEMLLNSAEQPCAEEVTGQRKDKKVNNLSQDLQDHCNTNSCFLPKSTVSTMSDSQFFPSSGDPSRSASSITLVNNPFGYMEHSGTNGFRENLSVKMQGELHPRQNSEGVSSDPELSGDVTLTEAGTGEDVAQDSALRPHSCCEVVTQSKNEVKCSHFDGDGGTSSQLCDNVTDTRRTPEGSANQTRTEVELLGDEHNIKEINESQLSIEDTNNKEDLDGCAALTINGTSWIRHQHGDLLPGDTSVSGCHSETSMAEASGSISGISPSRIISAMDKKTKERVSQLGCMESPDVGSEHFWSTKSNDIEPGSLLLALSPKSDPLGRDYSSPEETAIGETEFENAESITASHEACQGETIGVDCLKCTAVAENSPGFPDLVNNIALLRALTQHSTALESLQKMEENNNTFYE
ncbi:ZGRF1 protein, partial [Atrichornis clamosus]|nr:ZGRF1 protein [Atrichornis clamosus]